jgi:hypothetical protein
LEGLVFYSFLEFHPPLLDEGAEEDGLAKFVPLVPSTDVLLDELVFGDIAHFHVQAIQGFEDSAIGLNDVFVFEGVDYAGAIGVIGTLVEKA